MPDFLIADQIYFWFVDSQNFANLQDYQQLQSHVYDLASPPIMEFLHVGNVVGVPANIHLQFFLFEKNTFWDYCFHHF